MFTNFLAGSKIKIGEIHLIGVHVEAQEASGIFPMSHVVIRQ